MSNTECVVIPSHPLTRLEPGAVTLFAPEYNDIPQIGLQNINKDTDPFVKLEAECTPERICVRRADQNEIQVERVEYQKDAHGRVLDTKRFPIFESGLEVVEFIKTESEVPQYQGVQRWIVPHALDADYAASFAMQIGNRGFKAQLKQTKLH